MPPTSPFDRLDKLLLRRGALGFSLTGVILVLLMGFGPGLAALATLAVVYLVLNAAINGAGHTFGYKSFANDATNLGSSRSSPSGRACTTTTTPVQPQRALRL